MLWQWILFLIASIIAWIPSGKIQIQNRKSCERSTENMCIFCKKVWKAVVYRYWCVNNVLRVCIDLRRIRLWCGGKTCMSNRCCSITTRGELYLLTRPWLQLTVHFGIKTETANISLNSWTMFAKIQQSRSDNKKKNTHALSQNLINCLCLVVQQQRQGWYNIGCPFCRVSCGQGECQ